MLETANLIAIACTLIMTVGDLTIVDAILEENVTEYNRSLHGLNKSETIGDRETEGTVRKNTDYNTVENKTKERLLAYTTITRDINTEVNSNSSDTTTEATSENTTKMAETMNEENYKYNKHYTSKEKTRFERILVRQPFDMPKNIPDNYTGSEIMKAREPNNNETEKETRRVSYVGVAEEVGFIKENILKAYINFNKTGTNPDNSAIRCLSCNIRTVPGCYDPLGQNVAVRKCEVSTSLCFTRFGADGEEVERDCFSQQTVDVTHACASSLCNDIPASSIPLIYNRVVWMDYLRSLYIFMKRNTIPLRCLSCESSESYLDIVPNYDEDCINPPKNGLENMSVECRRDELCETARVRGRVTRGCARVPHDSAFLVCAEDECNNHVDMVQELYYRKQQLPSKGCNLLSNNMIVYCCFIIFYIGSQ